MSEKQKLRGRPIECLSCGHKFKLTKEQKKEWEDTKLPCPNCNSLYCNKPPTEVTLFKIQDKYLEGDESGNIRLEKYLLEMYAILVPYSKSMILESPSRPYLSIDDIDYKAHRSAVYLLENYLHREEWKIDSSFAGYLGWAINHSLYHESEKPAADISFQDLNNNSDGYSGDYDFYNNCRNLEEVDLNDDALHTKQRILDILFKTFKNIDFSTLVAINVFLNKGEEGVDKFFRYNETSSKANFLHIINKFKQELIKIHKERSLRDDKNYEQYY